MSSWTPFLPPLEDLHLRCKGQPGVKGKERAAAARVTQPGQIGAGRAIGIDVEHGHRPVGEHGGGLTVGRLDDDRVKVAWLLPMRVEERAVRRVMGIGVIGDKASLCCIMRLVSTPCRSSETTIVTRSPTISRTPAHSQPSGSSSPATDIAPCWNHRVSLG